MEQWKDIKGFEGFYRVSNTGLVASCDRMWLHFTGIERERKYFDIACRRIEDAQRQTSIFEQPAARAEQHGLAL